MVHREFRVVLAVLATFVSLVGIAVAIHGMLFEQDEVTLYGASATVIGMAASAFLLNLWPRDRL